MRVHNFRASRLASIYRLFFLTRKCMMSQYGTWSFVLNIGYKAIVFVGVLPCPVRDRCTRLGQHFQASGDLIQPPGCNRNLAQDGCWPLPARGGLLLWVLGPLRARSASNACAQAPVASSPAFATNIFNTEFWAMFEENHRRHWYRSKAYSLLHDILEFQRDCVVGLRCDAGIPSNNVTATLSQSTDPAKT
jgi:hypothetical protein